MTLQKYDFEVRYRPGNSVVMRPADALSRIDFSLYLADEDEKTRTVNNEQQDVPFLRHVISKLDGVFFKGLSSHEPVKVIYFAQKCCLTEWTWT